MVALAAPLALDDMTAGAVVGGLGLALALLNKYSLGVAAVPGVLAMAAATGSWRGGLMVVGSGGAIALVGYAVAARSGVGPSMVRRVFRNKRTFVATAGAGFLAGWRTTAGRPAVQLVGEWRVSWVTFGLTTLSAGMVLLGGAVAVARAATTWRRRARRGDDSRGAGVPVAASRRRARRNSLALWTVPAVAAAHRLDPAVGVGWAILVAGAALVAAGAGDRPSSDASARPRRAERRSTASTRGPGTWMRCSRVATSSTGSRAGPSSCCDPMRRCGTSRPASATRRRTTIRSPRRSAQTDSSSSAANLASGRVRYCCWSPANAGALTPVYLEEYAASLPVVARTVAGALVTAR